MNTFLSIATEGLFTTQGPFIEVGRTLTLTGSVREITGRPSVNVMVEVALFNGPTFNIDDLVTTRPRRVFTDQNGEISTDPNNQLVVMQPPDGGRAQIRIRIPDAGVDWIIELPNEVVASFVGVGSISLRDLYDQCLVEDRSRR